jgi:hypothetical protein
MRLGEGIVVREEPGASHRTIWSWIVSRSKHKEHNEYQEAPPNHWQLIQGWPYGTVFGTIISPDAVEKLVLVVTRIPTHRNDGSKISPRERRAILTLMRDALGGYSLEGPFQGAWVADDGRVYEETSYRLEVLVSAKRVSEARDLFVRVGKQLGQRAIYFEVRESGEIIDLA